MFEIISTCQGTKFRAETTSVSEISVAMQQDALLSFWPTYAHCQVICKTRTDENHAIDEFHAHTKF